MREIVYKWETEHFVVAAYGLAGELFDECKAIA